jgi:hypothetical protein
MNTERQAPMIVHVRFCLLLVTILAHAATACAEAGPTNAFQMRLVVNRDRILPCEPIAALAIIQNISTQAQVLIPYGRTEIQFRKGPSLDWQVVLPPGPVADRSLPLSAWKAKRFQPGEAITNVCFIHIGYQGPVFSEPGSYALKARHRQLCGSKIQDWLVSDIRTIEVLTPTGQDAAAHDFVQRHGLYRCFRLRSDLGSPMQTNDPMLRDVSVMATNYAGSVYAEYGCLFGGFQAGFSQQPFAGILEREGTGLGDWARYYLALRYSGVQQPGLAKWHFARVWSQTKDPVLKHLCEGRLSSLESVVASTNLVQTTKPEARPSLPDPGEEAQDKPPTVAFIACAALVTLLIALRWKRKPKPTATLP